MAKRIRVTAGEVSAEAQLNDTTCADAVYAALPITAKANTWGHEIYFEIPVDCELTEPRDTVESGDLAFWPAGSCFCIFFGPTPMSQRDEIRPASVVEVFGRLIGDPKMFKKVATGAEVLVECTD